MDYEQYIKKSVQYHSNIYCVTQKPLLSFGFSFNHNNNSTNFLFDTNISKNQKDSKWSSKFHLTVLNYQYPRMSLWIFPYQYLSIHLSSQNYIIKLNPVHPSITFNLSTDPLLNYSVTASFIDRPSVIGSFNIKKKILMSIRLYEKKIAMFSNIKGTIFDLYSGLKFHKADSFLDSKLSSFTGIKIPLSNDQSFSTASGFSLNSIKTVVAYRSIHHRITSIFLNAPIYNGETYTYNNFYHIQYKYITNNRSKIAFLYSFSSRNLFLRGSFKAFNKLIIKMTARLYRSEDKFHFNPGFGFLYQF